MQIKLVVVVVVVVAVVVNENSNFGRKYVATGFPDSEAITLCLHIEISVLHLLYHDLLETE